MLQSINDRIQGWLGWLIVAFISVPFALWGIQSYLDVGGEKFVAKVNDVEITTPQFDRALSQQRARLQQMFGKNLPNNAAYDELLKKQVLEQLITTEVLNQYAAKQGFSLSDQSLAAQIRQIDAFKEDGQFSQKLYERVLSSQGLSPAGFEAIYRQELATRQVQQAILNSAFVTETAVNQSEALKLQQRNISFITFKAADFLSQINVSDEDAKQFYSDNSFRYMNPEQISVQYVELKAEDLANEIPVNEEAIKKRYDEYVASVKNNEQRKARHILVNLPSDADAATEKAARERMSSIKSKLDAGADFSKLAKENSEDQGSAENGGDLGLVTRGMMVKPFEDTLFALNKNQVSDVVRTEFGLHLIKLDDVQTPKVESFASKKSELEKELKESGVQNLFYERAEMMANLAYENPESLDLVAEQMKLQIQSSALFSRNTGTGIASDPKVRNTAFQDVVLKENLNSDAIELANKHVVVLRLAQHKPATPKSFEEVKASIIAEMKNTQASQMAVTKASEVFKSLNKDSSVSNWQQTVQANKSDVTSLNLVKRDSSAADRQIIQEAFRLPKPADKSVSVKQMKLNNGNSAVVAVQTVVDADITSATADAAVKNQLSERIGGTEFSAAIDAIKAQFEIYIPEKKADE